MIPILEKFYNHKQNFGDTVVASIRDSNQPTTLSSQPRMPPQRQIDEMLNSDGEQALDSEDLDDHR